MLVKYWLWICIKSNIDLEFSSNSIFSIMPNACTDNSKAYSWHSLPDFRQKLKFIPGFCIVNINLKLVHTISADSNYFKVNFDHVWSQLYSLRQLEQLWNLAWALNRTTISKFRPPNSVKHTVELTLPQFWLKCLTALKRIARGIATTAYVGRPKQNGVKQWEN